MKIKIIVISIVCISVYGCSKLLPEAPESTDVIAEPIEGLTAAQMNQHIIGDELFAKVYSKEDGAGPIFIQQSCEGCHVGDGKGSGLHKVVRFGKFGGSEFDYMTDKGGPQLQYRAFDGYPTEQIPEDAEFVSERLAPINAGLGLMASVHDTTILGFIQKQLNAGIIVSGKPNYLDPEEWFVPLDIHVANGGKYIGRYGKKARKITLKDQIVFALKEDIGLTSDFDMEDLYHYSLGEGGKDEVADPEVPASTVDHLVFYLSTLKAPTRRDEDDADVLAGEMLFKSIGCNQCHVESMTTAPNPIEALSEKEIHPYTDFLLHDMGDPLGDGYPEGSASGNEWRTAPLWGLGLAADSQGGQGYYLHDGRATTLREAIELHLVGDAGPVATRFVNELTTAEQEQLITFLKSL